MISNPEVNRTLATLRKAEFGFLGVIVEKLTDKSPLLPLYRTVHEIFASYGSSFNSFEVIGSFSSFDNLLPSSTPSRRVTRTNSVTFSCSNWTLPFFDYSQSLKGEDYSLFNKHLRIQSHDLIIRTRDLFRSIPLPLILRESERSFSSLNLFIWNLGSSTSFLFTYFFIIFFPLFSFFISFFYFIPFHHSLSPIGLILSNLIHFLIVWSIFSLSEGYEINRIDFSVKRTMWNLRFFPLSLSLSHRYSIWINREPFLLYLYEPILFHSNSFPIPPKENHELDPKLTG